MRRLMVLIVVATLFVLAPGAPARADGSEAPGAPEPFRSLSAGGYHSCAVHVDGTLSCWGSNGDGRLGLGDTTDRGEGPGEMGHALPPVDLGTGRTATAVSAGETHTCALLDNGQVKCWGGNGIGQLGLGDTTARGDVPGEMGNALPAVDLGTGRTATAIAAGALHTCALLDNGQVKCWGENDEGELGDGDTTDRGDGPAEMGDNLPAVDLGTGRTATAITTSTYHTCALLDTGQVKCWGIGDAGRLGYGDTNHRGDQPGEMGNALPAVDLGTGRTATAVTAGVFQTCALLDNGQVKCWGNGADGRLGYGDTTIRGDGPGEMGNTLPPVDLGTGRTATAITTGFDHTCALLDNDQVTCWGANATGQLGHGDTVARGDGPGEMGNALPAVDLGTGRTATAITTGYGDTCALLDNDQVKCWGENVTGKLGLGDTADRGDGPGEMGNALPPVVLTPANDDLASAAQLSGAVGSVRGSNANASKQPGEPNHDGFTAADSSVWYRWTAPANGSVTVDTVGSTFDTVLAVYTGTAVNALTPVASNDDAVGLQSQLAFTATAGTTYRIAVAGFSGGSGHIVLNWLQRPANDAFAAPVTLAGPNGTQAGNNLGAGKEPGEPNHAGFAVADSSVWYQWTAPAAGPVTIDTFSSTFDTVLAVYTGTAVNALTPVASNDDTDTVQSRVDFTAVAGSTYRITVTGFNGEGGDITLHWIQRPTNDAFATAATLTGASGTQAGNTDRAGSEPGEPNHNPNGSSSGSIWYQWTAPAAGRTSFSTSGSAFDTVLAVYTGSTVNALTLVGNNDDQAANDLRSRVVFTATAGTTYRIAVAGYLGSFEGDHGATQLAWTQAAACDGRAVTVALAFGDAPTAGNDVIRGTAAGERINGANGLDRICGGGGADTLVGGNGNDRLLGEAGTDTLQGGAGTDFLNGGTQRDTCNGGPQRDTQTGCEVRTSIP